MKNKKIIMAASVVLLTIMALFVGYQLGVSRVQEYSGEPTNNPEQPPQSSSDVAEPKEVAYEEFVTITGYNEEKRGDSQHIYLMSKPIETKYNKEIGVFQYNYFLICVPREQVDCGFGEQIIVETNITERMFMMLRQYDKDLWQEVIEENANDLRAPFEASGTRVGPFQYLYHTQGYLFYIDLYNNTSKVLKEIQGMGTIIQFETTSLFDANEETLIEISFGGIACGEGDCNAAILPAKKQTCLDGQGYWVFDSEKKNIRQIYRHEACR
jgi:hypothetical protein